MTTLRPVRRDQLPENVNYEDDGCSKGGGSCLTCPLAVCVYDSEPERLVAMKSRNRLILRMRKSGRPVKKIASAFGVSTRTVHRVIQTGGVVRGPLTDPDEAPLLTTDAFVALQRIRARKPWPVLLENRGSA